MTLATRAGARLSELLAWRFLIAAVLLAIVAGGPSAVRREARRGLPLVVLAGGGQAAIGGLSLGALRYIPAATMIFLFYTYPAWVTVLSALRGKEPLTGRRLIALVLSLAGIAVMVGLPGTGASSVATPGVLLALAGALLYALYIPMIDHLGRDLSPALTATYATGGRGDDPPVAAALSGGFARPASERVADDRRARGAVHGHRLHVASCAGSRRSARCARRSSAPSSRSGERSSAASCSPSRSRHGR